MTLYFTLHRLHIIWLIEWFLCGIFIYFYSFIFFYIFLLIETVSWIDCEFLCNIELLWIELKSFVLSKNVVPLLNITFFLKYFRYSCYSHKSFKLSHFSLVYTDPQSSASTYDSWNLQESCDIDVKLVGNEILNRVMWNM